MYKRQEQFRASGGGENHAFVHRALVEMTVRDRFLSATAELEDSRVYSGISNAPMNQGIVNTVELLQGYVAGEFTDAFEGQPFFGGDHPDLVDFAAFGYMRSISPFPQFDQLRDHAAGMAWYNEMNGTLHGA